MPLCGCLVVEHWRPILEVLGNIPSCAVLCHTLILLPIVVDDTQNLETMAEP